MKEVINIAPVICEGCGKVFKAKYAHYCPACLRKINSERAKKIGLNKLGNAAYSKQQAAKKESADNGEK